jgi:hypothetical protein
MKNERWSTLFPEDRAYLGQTNYKRFLAYQQLGVRPQDVEIVPLFRAQLSSLTRCISRDRGEGNTQSRATIGPFSYLEHSSDPDARKALAAYESVPASYRRLLPPEAFCLAAGVSPRRVLEMIAIVLVQNGGRLTDLRAAVAQKRVLGKTLERALQDEGWRERLTIHKATGAVPTWGWKGGDTAFAPDEAQAEESPNEEL